MEGVRVRLVGACVEIRARFRVNEWLMVMVNGYG
jgi:hypothetical protein